MLSESQVIVNSFGCHFVSVYIDPRSWIDGRKSFSSTGTLRISELDVTNAIKLLKDRTTAGYEQILSFLIKDYRDVFVNVKPLCFLFNLALRTSYAYISCHMEIMPRMSCF